MPFVDVIARKRDGQTLTRDEIDRFAAGVADGSIPDHQASALLMAIVIRGMSREETAWLTDAMLRSGQRVDLSGLSAPTVGKHSTGGVGDKLSLVFVPLVAACGVIVPKMSGRGLGHTGGTLDKLESIPGFRVDIGIDDFVHMLRATGAAIVGQTKTLVPADRKLYALRDVTATVESVPLIASSIMSKKLAEGARALLLDVKCGRGAFMKREADARELAGALVDVGQRAGLRTEAIITAMDAPLGRSVGNAIELIEAIELLKGRGPADLRTLAVLFATRALVLAGAFEATQAVDAVERALASGAALETLRAMIAQQGGDPRVVDDYGRLPGADTRVAIAADRRGYVAGLDAELIGRASMRLGAGREQLGEAIDHGAGVRILRACGEWVDEGEPVLELLCNGGRGLESAGPVARAAIHVAATPPEVPPLVIGVVAPEVST